MPRPVCVKCQKEMSCQKNDFIVSNESVLYNGDKYKCPTCEYEVVVGFGSRIELYNSPSWQKILEESLKKNTAIIVDNL